MRTAWKVLWMGAALIVAFAMLLIALAFAVNFRDEPLGPQALALRAVPANPLPDDKNLYLALVGAHAPAGEAPTKWGAQIVVASNSQIAAAAEDPARTPLPPPDIPDALEFKGKLPACASVDEACWNEASRNAAGISRLLADNQELVARYRALWSLAGYFDTAHADLMEAGAAPFPAFGGDARKLVLADIAARLQAGTLERRRAALQDLLADLATWRRVLVGQGNLLSSMLALSWLQADEQLLALMIADPGVPLERMAGVQPAPVFDQTDWRLGGAFASEFRASVPIWERFGNPKYLNWVQPREESAWSGWWRRRTNRLANFFLQPHATENLYAGMYQTMIAVGDAPPAELPAEQERARQWSKARLEAVGWRMAYNPMGRILVAIAVPAFENYPLRAWDVAAHQRMVRLSWEIRRNGIRPESVPAFIKAHPEWSVHPVSGAAASWDGKAGTLAMQPLSKRHANVSYSIPAWRAGDGS